MSCKLMILSLLSGCAGLCVAVWILTRTDSRLNPSFHYDGISNIVSPKVKTYIRAILMLVSLTIFMGGNGIFRFIGACLAAWPVASFARLYWSKHRAYYKRRDAMEQWPNILHYMSVACLSGMDIRDSFSLASSKTKGHLKDELSKVMIRISGGASLKSAIKVIAIEDFPQFRRFANMLSQAEVLGTPIADVLNSLAQEAHILERQEFEARVNALPVKISVVTAFFLLPPVLVVSVVPRVLEFINIAW